MPELENKLLPRVLLLVDDEINILAALKRLFRHERYEILTAQSGVFALKIMLQQKVDVIVSDQRMPEMSGVELFRIVKNSHPDTVRMVLSGYTELQSVTDAVNEGAVYKFLIKPWDDLQLRQHVADAFQRKEMADENQRLHQQLLRINAELQCANDKLDQLLQQKCLRVASDEACLNVVREMLQHVPQPVIGIDEGNAIVFINAAVKGLSSQAETVLGKDVEYCFPVLHQTLHDARPGARNRIELKGRTYETRVHSMGEPSSSHGKLISFMQSERHEG